eukprot:contig_14503_g3490
MSCGHTPLCLAVVRGNVGMVRTLLDAGANVNARTEEDMTPLLLAAEKGTPAAMGQLLRADPPPNITAVNERTHTALMLAAWCNTPGVVAKLLEAGAAADTGMNCGAPVASEAVVRLLLGAGADSAGPGARVAPLYLAAEAGATAVVSLLLEATPPAPLEATAADGSTAALVAAQNGHAPALRALLNAGARADAVRAADDGNSGLHLAVMCDHLDAVPTLLAASTVNVAVTNVAGYTPLHVAAERPTAAASKLLLAAGAAVDATTPDGASALHLAAAAGEIMPLTCLLEA